MNDQVTLALAHIMGEHGMGIVRDANKCERLLRASCGRSRTEVFLLLTALQAGVVGQLISSDPSIPVATTLQRIGRKLHKSLAIVEDAATWAVGSWAAALGLCALPPPGVGGDKTGGDESGAKVEVNNSQPPAAEGCGYGLLPATSGQLGERESDQLAGADASKIECPNCCIPLLVQSRKDGEFAICCPFCQWRFRVDCRGSVVDSGSVATQCPYPDCGAPVISTGGEELCDKCGRVFQVNGTGGLLGGLIPCPRCGENLYHPDASGDVTCSACGCTITVGDGGEVVSGFLMLCPYCNKENAAEPSKSVNCCNCGLRFTTDGAGQLVGTKVACPKCHRELYIPQDGGTRKCSDCGHTFEVDSVGRITRGFAVECPLCDRKIRDDGPGLARCNKCGLRLEIDAHGMIVRQPDISTCPHCEERYRADPNVDLCPRCGQRISS